LNYLFEYNSSGYNNYQGVYKKFGVSHVFGFQKEVLFQATSTQQLSISIAYQIIQKYGFKCTAPKLRFSTQYVNQVVI
jgi:hypothetical protein